MAKTLLEMAAELTGKGVTKALAVDDVVTVDPNETMNPIVAGEVLDAVPAPELPAAPAREALKPGFVMAGKATFTVSNPAGTRYTFRVERPDRFRGEYFASVMNGTDNETSYAYIGMMNERGIVRATPRSKVAATDIRAKVLRWALDAIFGNVNPLMMARALRAGYRIEHAGKCGVCGRLLTVPDSIRSGIGPECSKKMGRAA